MIKKILGFILLLMFLSVSVFGTIFSLNLTNKSNNNLNNPSDACTQVCTHLPIMLINTNNQIISKESKSEVNIKIVDYESGNSISAKPNFETEALINYRGNSSYSTFDKLQYRVKFYSNISSENTKNFPLFGMTSSSDWVLYGPFLDRTLIRNHLMFSLSRDLLEWAPDTRYFELYVDSEYQGVYLAIEPISVGEGRIDLNRFGLLSGETPYIIRRDRVGTENNVIHTYGEIMGFTSNELSIHYPGNDSLTSKQYDWIKKDVSRFEEVLYSDYFDNPNTGYAKYMNVSSFVDYFILNEFAMITDSSELSTYLYKDLSGKLTFTVWDFNNGFNNYQWSDQSYQRYFNLDSNWFKRLIQDRTFVDRIVKRYEELRLNELSDANLMNRIDEDVEYLGDAIQRNFEVWGYTFHQELLSKDSSGLNRDPKSYEEAVNMLKEVIILRLEYMDQTINQLYEYSIN
ncbi:MAG: CotH kinase family protein [Erysipelotrichaceae bacterium]